MKRMKKLASVLLAVAMVLSLSVTAFADERDQPAATSNPGSIKITNAVPGQTYSAYKLFDATVGGTDTNKVITYTGEIPTQLTNYFELSTDGRGIVVKKGATGTDGKLIPAAVNALKAWAATQQTATNTVKAPTAEGEATTVEATISNLPYGYYVVTTTTGTAISVDSTNPQATVTDKNEGPDIDKQVQTNPKVTEGTDPVWGTDSTAQIGDNVNYKTTVSAKPGAVNYVVEDKMTKGLTFNNDVAIEGLTEDTDYTVETWTLTNEEKAGKFETGFKVVFKQSYLDTITEAKNIVITYSATLNKDAVIADLTNDNDTRLTYGRNSDNHTEWKETKTKTFSFDLVKTDVDDKLLAGAKFKLYDAETGGTEIALVKNNDGSYRVAVDNEAGVEIETNATSKIVVKGLDANTTYYLEETEAPAGYNKLSARVKVEMKEVNLTATMDDAGTTYQSGNIHVVNKTGTELPSTGGMGTKMLYTVGGILVVGAGVLMITKRRMGN